MRLELQPKWGAGPEHAGFFFGADETRRTGLDQVATPSSQFKDGQPVGIGVRLIYHPALDVCDYDLACDDRIEKDGEHSLGRL